jgi:hypothetical protein
MFVVSAMCGLSLGADLVFALWVAWGFPVGVHLTVVLVAALLWSLLLLVSRIWFHKVTNPGIWIVSSSLVAMAMAHLQ